MKTQLLGLLRLTRCNELTWQVVVCTMVGAAAGHGRVGWPLIVVLAANWLSVAFAFMINDVEDAADDARDPAKVKRNPVSAGIISDRLARVASYAVALASFALYALLGTHVLAFGLVAFALGQLYSWRRVRLKRMPIVDLVSHSLMLGGLQFLAAMTAFGPRSGGDWVFPFAMLVSISMYGELHNEVRDGDGDVKAGLKHTAILVGPKVSRGLMAACLTVGVGAGVVAIFVHGLIPVWVLPCILGLALVLMAARMLRQRRFRGVVDLEGAFHKPFEMAGAISMTGWIVWQWLAPWLAPWLALRLTLVTQWLR